jgi:hypothetical protein
MMTRRQIAAAWLLAAFLAASASAQDATRPVKILAIVPPSSTALTVALVTPGDGVRGMIFTGILPALINQSVVQKRNAPLSGQLRDTLAGYDLSQPIIDGLAKSFADRNAMFEVTGTTERGKYLTEKYLPTGAAEGFDFLLVVEPTFVGLGMASNLFSHALEMAPVLTVKFRTIRVAGKREQLIRGSAHAYGLDHLPYKEAIASRELFTSLWPSVALAAANYITGTLNRTDTLHAMAESVGRGAEVPAIKEVLKRYERSFAWDLRPLKDWRETRFDTNFVRVLEPKSDLRATLGLRFEVDILVKEFGQDRVQLDEYIRVFDLRRMDELDDPNPLVPFDDIDAPGYEKYAYDVAGGGRVVTLFRMLDERRVEVLRVVILKDFASLYPQHRAAAEQMIRTHGIELRR